MANPAVRERLAKVDTDPSFAPGPALEGQARERDQELVDVHRRQGHQGRTVTAVPLTAVMAAPMAAGDRHAMAIEFTVNGRPVSVDADGSDAAAVGAARRACTARQQVRLRHRAVRRLHGADRRQAGVFLRARGGDGRGPQHHHHRRAFERRRAASAAAGVPRRAGRPVRLLPVRHPDFGGGAAGQECQAEPRRDRRRARSRICAAAASTTASSAPCRRPEPSDGRERRR